MATNQEKPIGRAEFTARASERGFGYWKLKNETLYANYIVACEKFGTELVNKMAFTNPTKSGIYSVPDLYGLLVMNNIFELDKKPLNKVSETVLRSKLAEMAEHDKIALGGYSTKKLMRTKVGTSGKQFKIGGFFKVLNEQLLAKEGFNFF